MFLITVFLFSNSHIGVHYRYAKPAQHRADAPYWHGLPQRQKKVICAHGAALQMDAIKLMAAKKNMRSRMPRFFFLIMLGRGQQADGNIHSGL